MLVLFKKNATVWGSNNIGFLLTMQKAIRSEGRSQRQPTFACLQM